MSHAAILCDVVTSPSISPTAIQGVGGSRQSVGSLVSYKSLSTPEFRQLRPSEPLAQELLVGATKQSVHVTPDVAPGDSPAALEQLAIPAIATTSATGRGAMSGAVRGL